MIKPLDGSIFGFSKNQKRSVGLLILSCSLLLASASLSASNNVNFYISNEPDSKIQSTVTGTVTDEAGIPLAGASVVVKGTSTGTQTDFDGNFSISADADAVLVISYIGFLTSEVAVNGQTAINVQLTEDHGPIGRSRRHRLWYAKEGIGYRRSIDCFLRRHCCLASS